MRLEIEVEMTKDQYDDLIIYFKELPIDIILQGLRFISNRYRAKNGRYLFPGRKSIIKKETQLMTKDQATWRLNNWKTIIKSYRNKGYSYPTISRIKKEIIRISCGD